MLCKCCNTMVLNSNQIHRPILNAEWLLLNLPYDLLAENSANKFITTHSIVCIHTPHRIESMYTSKPLYQTAHSCTPQIVFYANMFDRFFEKSMSAIFTEELLFIFSLYSLEIFQFSLKDICFGMIFVVHVYYAAAVVSMFLLLLCWHAFSNSFIIFIFDLFFFI